MEKKHPNPKFIVMDPAKDLIDSWRLFRSSIVNEKWKYPSLAQTHEEEVRSHHYGYVMLNPNFFGMIARIGKRPIAQIIGEVVHRPLGDPKTFFFIWNFWMEPEFRKRGYMKTLWPVFMTEIKKRGVFYWEANGNDSVTEFLKSYEGYKTNILFHRIGGKIE
jgi:hypothetical protein